MKKILGVLVFSLLTLTMFLSLGIKTEAANNLPAPAPSSKLVQATPEQIVEINNSQPEVYIKNLVLDNTDYKAGGAVRGSFDISNGKDVAVSNLSYQASLVGDLMQSALYQYEFDSQILGTIFLDKNETKTINFEYKLPLCSSAYTLGKQLGIQIKTFAGSGLPLGWADSKVNISDSGIAPVATSNASIVVDGKTFVLDAGPTVYNGGKVSLKISASNNSSEDISNLTPKISIYDMNYAGSPLSAYSENEFSLKAKSKADLTFNLPTFNYTPKVYAGEMVIVDKNGINRSTLVKFRYIVYGEIVNIHNVVTDKSSAKKGDPVNVEVDYTGAPVDNITLAAAASTPSDFSLKLFNENNELVGEYSDKTTFAASGFKNVNLVLNKDAGAFSVDIVVSKNGNVMTEYKTGLLGEVNNIKPAPSTSAGKTENIIYISLAILLVIIIGAVLFIMKKKGLLIFLLLIFIGLGTFTDKAEAFTEVSSYAWPGWPTPAIDVASPSGYYKPGAQFNLYGTVTINSCNNSDYDVQLYASVIKKDTDPAPDAWAWAANGASTLIADSGWNWNSCNSNKETGCNSSMGFPDQYHTASYVAPSIPGNYRIYMLALQYETNPGNPPELSTMIMGYQPFIVSSMNANCTGSPSKTTTGTTVTWSATASGGTEPYSYTWQGSAAKNSSSPKEAVTYSTYSTAGKYTSYIFVKDKNGQQIQSDGCSVTISAAPLVAKCSPSPNAGTIGTLITWQSTTTGGTSPYTYSWSGGSGADAISGTSSTTTKTYTSTGLKPAILSVTDSSATPAKATANCDINIATPTPGCGSCAGTGRDTSECASNCPYCVSGSCSSTNTPPTTGCGSCNNVNDCASICPYCVSGNCSTTSNPTTGCGACTTGANCASNCPYCVSGSCSSTNPNPTTGCGSCSSAANCASNCPYCVSGSCSITNNPTTGCSSCTSANNCASNCPYCVSGNCSTTNPNQNAGCSSCTSVNDCASICHYCVAGNCSTAANPTTGCGACTTAANCANNCQYCVNGSCTSTITNPNPTTGCGACTNAGNCASNCPYCVAGSCSSTNTQNCNTLGCGSCNSSEDCASNCQYCISGECSAVSLSSQGESHNYCDYGAGAGAIWLNWTTSPSGAQASYTVRLYSNKTYSGSPTPYTSSANNGQDSSLLFMLGPDTGGGANYLPFGQDYSWKVQVADDFGKTSGWVAGGTFSTPSHASPAPSFNTSPISAPLTNSIANITFTDNNSQCYNTDGTNYSCNTKSANSYAWTFGDGQTSSAANPPVHAYYTATTYNTGLTVCDEKSYCCTATGTVTISPTGGVPTWKEIPPYK